MFQVYKSNRPERLVDALAERLAHDAPPPFEPEWICVQSRGMDVWLAMQLADRLGVHANAETHFPRSLIEKLLCLASGGDIEHAKRFDEERLGYAVLAVLPSLLDRPELAELEAYLSGDARGARLPQLARRIAGVFDRYSVFRPELLRRFEEGGGEGWQPVVWNALTEELRSARISSLSEAVAKLAAEGAPSLMRLPERVFLFGVSSLPPLLTRILAMLSEHLEVHLFVTSPSALFWADTVRGRGRTKVLPPDEGLDARRREVAHPLLGQFGKLSREFQDVLESEVTYQESGESLFVDPETGSLLAALQSDILNLRHRGSGEGAAPALPIDEADRSISIHDGHGPLREVEILRDQLIEALERDPTLEPEDIIVLTPDLETFGPLVQAAFGEVRYGDFDLPFRLAERPVRHGSTVNEAFVNLLALAKKRCTSVEVLDFAGLEPVRRRFGLEAEDMSLLATWVRASGVRFGRDERHRTELAQPNERRNTWAFGFDRLFLGYAFPQDRDRLFAGVSPYDEIEGASAEVLGRFAELCDRLFKALETMSQSLTLAKWGEQLEAWLDALVSAEDDHASAHQALRQAIREMAKLATDEGVTNTLPLDAALSLLAPKLTESVTTHGFLAGGITVSELLPLRGIPFRIIALLGMSDGAFPRRPSPVSFDLVAQSPERGDRSVRDEDLQLFLETLLSTRERLIITYSGQSADSPARFPPSVVVGALLDAIAEGFFVGDRAPATPLESRQLVQARLVTSHPLQAHSPRYFTRGEDSVAPGRLTSFDPRRREDALALLGPRHRPAAFMGEALPTAKASEGAAIDLSLETLTRFFTNPAKAFVRDRLGMKLELDEETLEEREASQLSALESHAILSQLTESLIEGRAPDELLPTLRARGLLPHGTMGELILRDLLALEAQPLAALVLELRRGADPQPTEVGLDLSGYHLAGHVHRTARGGLFHFTNSRLKPKYRLAAWVRHLALVAARPSEAEAAVAMVVGRGPKDAPATLLRFRPPNNARDLLERLLELYDAASTAPIPFFPAASFAYADRWAKKGGDRQEAQHSAINAWKSGEADDIYVAQLFPDASQLMSDTMEPTRFEQLALDVFGPMIEHTTEGPP